MPLFIDLKQNTEPRVLPLFRFLFPDAQLKSKQGVLAEYISLPQENIQKRPSNVSPVETAGVCLAALTALQSLDAANLEQDQTILINGGSTAVGSYAIQLAKIRGARVVATASGKNEKFVRDLGADEVGQQISCSTFTY